MCKLLGPDAKKEMFITFRLERFRAYSLERILKKPVEGFSRCNRATHTCHLKSHTLRLKRNVFKDRNARIFHFTRLK